MAWTQVGDYPAPPSGPPPSCAASDAARAPARPPAVQACITTSSLSLAWPSGCSSSRATPCCTHLAACGWRGAPAARPTWRSASCLWRSSSCSGAQPTRRYYVRRCLLSWGDSTAGLHAVHCNVAPECLGTSRQTSSASAHAANFHRFLIANAYLGWMLHCILRQAERPWWAWAGAQGHVIGNALAGVVGMAQAMAQAITGLRLLALGSAPPWQYCRDVLRLRNRCSGTGSSAGRPPASSMPSARVPSASLSVQA